MRPDHSVGEYYFLLRTWSGARSLGRFLARPLQSIATRYHLSHPWRIPFTLFAEIWGMAWALRLSVQGPRLLVRET